MKRIVCVIALILFIFANFRLDAFAQKYGEGKYGFGDYNVGDIYTIVDTSLTSGGITTNLGELSDPSAASNVYFEKVGFGKIQFNSTLDLTDPTVTTWLQALGTKLDMSTQNKISLDADTVTGLINTQAVLTMYNVTLNDPKILVNNVDDNSGVVTDLVYDRTAHTLTFNAAHFTTFTAVEKSSGTSSNNSGSSNSSGTPICNDNPPKSSPQLFQIDVTSTTATLNFVPSAAPLTYYYIAFGKNPANLEYGTQYNSSVYPGAQKVTINALKPNTKYYFKIRGGNGCMPGDWSGLIFTRTTLNSKSLKRAYYPTSRKIPESVFVAQTAAVVPKNTSKTISNTKTAPAVTSESSSTAPIPTAVIAPPFQEITPIPTAKPVSNQNIIGKISNFFSNLFGGFGRK